jgi:Uma2 family endonuclease
MELMSGHDGALPNPRGVKLTYDDFVLFPDDGLRHELIDGEHYVTPSPSIKHQQVSLNISYAIETYLRHQRIGRVFYAPLDVLLSPSDIVEPDLIYMSRARAAEIDAEVNVQGVPELVVEIGSPRTRRRDETVKRSLYERAGVTEYWVIDPELDVVRVYRRNGERFARPQELSSEAGDVLSTSLLPGLELALRDIFRSPENA